jgi:hypothetical protein
MTIIKTKTPVTVRKLGDVGLAADQHDPEAFRSAELRAAIAVLSIGTPYADSEGGQNANTQFTSIPGFLAQAPAQNAPAVAIAQNGQAVRAYVTQSSHGTWLFPPHQGGGQNG